MASALNNFIFRLYTLLHLLEFNPARKRMSVIVRNPDKKLLLLCKGADRFDFYWPETVY